MTEVLTAAEELRVKRQDHFFQQLQLVIQNAIVKALSGKS